MTDLRETVARERDDALSFLDNAVSDAPEPLLWLGEYLADLLDEDRWPTAERYLNSAVKSVDEAKRQRDAALKVAREALNKAASQFEFYAENHRRKNTKDGDQKAEVNGDLGCEMRQALAQIDAAEELTAASLPRS